ncbi:MAG: AI-2E family transporter [Desulfovibrio sp.]
MSLDELLDTEKKYTFDRVIRIGFFCVVVWGLFYILQTLGDALLPFVVALVLAYLIDPIVKTVNKFVTNRSFAVGLTLVGVIIVVVGVCWITIPMVSAEIARLAKLLGQFIHDSKVAARATQYFSNEVVVMAREFIAQADLLDLTKSTGLLDIVTTAAQKFMPKLLKLLSGTAHSLTIISTFFIILLYLVFLLCDYDKLRNWREQLPPDYRQPVGSFVDEFEDAVNRYFRTQFLIALLMGVLFAVGFSIIGLPLAVVLGFFTGILNFVPYLQILGFIPALILAVINALVSGESLWMGVGGVLAVFAVVQILQDAVVVPKLQGESLGLSPWMILLSLSIWGQLLGFLGLVLALPLTCLLLTWYRRYVVKIAQVDEIPPLE